MWNWLSDFLWYFERNSSDVDWCETNYEVSPYIAEFYNTFSNLPFVVLPPLLMYLFRNYANYVSPELNIVWFLLIIVGLGSSYFHATLSFSGQIVDELAILWVLLAAMSVAIPDSKLVGFPFYGSREKLKRLLAISSVFGTVLAFVNPQINAILLQCFALPFLILLGQNMSSTRNWTVIRLLAASVFWWMLAVTCWINDRVFCQLWRTMLSPFGIQYLQFHGWWHVLIVIGSYTAVVVVAYFRAKESCAERRPRIAYWPETRWAWEVGVPFVKVDTAIRQENKKSM
jgi:alkaline ceramidase